MSAFTAAAFREAKDTSKLTLGENGHACISVEGLENPLLALFDRFFQGINEADLRDGLRSILEVARNSTDIELVADTFVLAFSVRWCRGGKGAKLAFYQCIKILYEDFPTVIVKLLPLIPEFGYWKDYMLLLEEIRQHPVPEVDYTQITQEIWKLYANQLKSDFNMLETCKSTGIKPKISFAGKYAPREKKQFAKSLHAVSELARRMFPPLNSGTDETTVKPNKKRYRETVSALSAALDVPEVKMCAHQYAAINMASVPSRCMKLQSKAFANELIKGAAPEGILESTGNRYPEDEDRVQARQNLITALSSKGVKGGQVYPHEFVSQITKRKVKSVVDRLTINSQWNSMRESIDKMVRDRMELKPDGTGGAALGKLVPLCDVSGSMSGTPMEVSIGLGILCSELTNVAFRDLVLCFSKEAQWFNLSDCTGIVEKVNKMMSAPWGMNTDFNLAMQRILKIVVDNNLKQEDVPNLLVISDMQFDAAGGSHWNTAYENIEIMFRDAGIAMCGVPLSPPTIIFWNVRAAIGFPAASDQKGVIMLSGFSPALLKFVLSGELMCEEEVENEDVGMVVVNENGETEELPATKVVKRQVTPAEAMHVALHEEIYDPIREILKACTSEELAIGASPLSRHYVRVDA